MIKIDYKKCCWKNGRCASCGCIGGCGNSKCEGCVEACPVQALARKKRVEFYKEKCIDCGACAAACKHDAISMI